MSLLFLESFDLYDTSYLEDRGWAIAGAYTPDAQIVAGGRNGQGLQLSGDFAITATYTPASLENTFIVGFALKLGGPDSDRFSMRFKNSVIGEQLFLTFLPGGIVRIHNSIGTVIGYFATDIIPGIWYYVEVKATMDALNGTLDVRVNGQSVYSDVGLPLGGDVDGLQFYAWKTGGIVDDVYICSGGGAVNNDFLGDTYVQKIMPTANSSHAGSNDWTPSAGANWECVDEAPPDGDTSYISSSNPTDLDSFEVQDIDMVSGNVCGVQVNLLTRLDAGSPTVTPTVWPNGAGAPTAGASAGSSPSFEYVQQIFETNPSTGALWSIAEINSAELGIRLESA